MSRIYLDHNASTPVRPEVLEAMLPYFAEHFGNASSVHAFGQEAKGAVEDARAQVAALLNATPGEIVFTSGGTESDNIGVIGGAHALPFKGRHIIVSAIEHDAVRHAADALEREGYTVTRVAPDARGVVSAESVAAAIRPDTALVTIAGHKFYGPKGVGALYVKRGFKPVPLQFGGEHEKGRRPGTENVPAIVGLGKASELARSELSESSPRIDRLRDRMERALMDRVPNVVRHGEGAPRVPNTSHLSFVGAEGEHLILSLDMKGIAVSSGAACKAGSSHPSHVLLAMGVPREIAQAAVRFSLGRCSTEEEIDRGLEIVPAVVQKLRAASPAAAS